MSDKKRGNQSFVDRRNPQTSQIAGFTLDRLIRIAIDISAERDLNVLMRLILSESMDITSCDGGTVYIKEGDFLCFHTMCTKSKGVLISPAEGQNHLDIPPVPLGKRHVSAACALENKKINIADVYKSEEYDFTGTRDYDARNGYRTGSTMVIPMDDENGNVVGVLQLLNAQDAEGRTIPFAPEYERLLSALASLAAVALNNRRLAQEVVDMLHAFVRVMVDSIDARSPYNANHTRSMVAYAERFLDYLSEADASWSIPEGERDPYLMSIWLHDIGKLLIPEEVLDKPDRLGVAREQIRSRVQIACLSERIRALSEPAQAQDAEWRIAALEAAWKRIEEANSAPFLSEEQAKELAQDADLPCRTAEGEEVPLLAPEELEAITVRRGTLTDAERRVVESHVTYTARMLAQMNFRGFYEKVPFWAGSHHELLDGSGYPEHLTAEDLPRETRLLTILDIYDALTAEDRPYKPPMEPEKAFGILQGMADEGKVDGEILRMFRESGAWRK